MWHAGSDARDNESGKRKEGQNRIPKPQHMARDRTTALIGESKCNRTLIAGHDGKLSLFQMAWLRLLPRDVSGK